MLYTYICAIFFLHIDIYSFIYHLSRTFIYEILKLEITIMRVSSNNYTYNFIII